MILYLIGVFYIQRFHALYYYELPCMYISGLTMFQYLFHTVIFLFFFPFFCRIKQIQLKNSMLHDLIFVSVLGLITH